MPYIIVRCLLDNTHNRELGRAEILEELFKGSKTHIDYNGDYEGTGILEAMSSLSATRVGDTNSPHCTYGTTQPPYEVLNKLEILGYNVVGTHSTLIIHTWTLHKKAEH